MSGMSVAAALEELRGLREWLADRLVGMPARAARCETMEASAKIGDEAYKFERWIEALDRFAPPATQCAAAPDDDDPFADQEGDERMWGYDGDALR